MTTKTTTFITILEAKVALKGNIKFKVLSLGDLKTGNTKTGQPYEKQSAVIKDASGAMNLTLWSDDIGKLEPGQSYALSNPWWSLYKGEPQLALGNYYTLEPITEDELLAAAATPTQHPAQESLQSPSAPATGGGIPVPRASVDDKLDAILNELDILKGMVQPLFKKMVDEQIAKKKEESQNEV